MNGPIELPVPDYVPDELVRMYGGRSERRFIARRSSPHDNGRDVRRVRLRLTCWLAVLAVTMVAPIAAAPEPLTAAVWLGVLLSAATVVSIVAVHALVRADAATARGASHRLSRAGRAPLRGV